MLAEFLEAKPRDFSLTSVPGLTKEAREAINEALKAMSAWRNETADTSQKNSKQEPLAKLSGNFEWAAR